MRALRSITPALALAVAAPIAAMPTAGSATPAVKFTSWQADYSGTSVPDSPITQAKLNGEYITIANTTTSAKNIGGYRVSDAGSKHVYTIPRGFVLGAKKSVVLRTGQGRNTSTTLYWGQAVSGLKPVARNGYVWNNDTDTATLRNASGTTLHVCTYKRVTSGFRTC